ncbi:hypothetical protein [Flavobacterium agricola]|uniref:hypothetical protein n=1 Tax=Flavobacterium agricola TaxID=2870839 RepID=UPI0022233BD5
MNAIFKNLLALVCLTLFITGANAQQVASSTTKLSMGKVEPYEMQVTYSKTSHLIFPSAIRYVDLGSVYVVKRIETLCLKKLRERFCFINVLFFL